MNKIARLVKERGVNRKVMSAIKGTRICLVYVELPQYEWFYFNMTKGLYHYDLGIFEAYAAKHKNLAFGLHIPQPFTHIII